MEAGMQELLKTVKDQGTSAAAVATMLQQACARLIGQEAEALVQHYVFANGAPAPEAQRMAALRKLLAAKEELSKAVALHERKTLDDGKPPMKFTTAKTA